MLRTRTTAALAASLLGSTLLASPALGTEDDFPTASLFPTQAPVGARVTISGDGCFRGDAPGWVNWSVNSTVGGKQYAVSYTPSGGSQAAADGTWSWSFEVPSKLGAPDGGSLVLEPGSEVEVNAICRAQDEDPDAWLRYPTLALEVMPSPTTTSTPSTTTSPIATPPPATPIEDPPPFPG